MSHYSVRRGMVGLVEMSNIISFWL